MGTTVVRRHDQPGARSAARDEHRSGRGVQRRRARRGDHLLVLDLHVTVGRGSLAAQVRHDWPVYAAYLVSFFTIGVVSVNHHALFSLARTVDRTLLFYNLVLIMFATLIPFTTSTLAEYLREVARTSASPWSWTASRPRAWRCRSG
ncbi:MAG: TMEM175 family protein [Jatrophihabitantaceae bacterium]